MSSTELESPMSFVNTKYRLAGGMDTPTLAEAAAMERDLRGSEYADGRYRTELGGKNGAGFGEGDILDELPRDGNGRPRVPVMRQESSEGWRLALEVVGGVVGKVWEFCKTSAFRGFHAGGGRGYDVKPPAVSDDASAPADNFWESTNLPTLPSLSVLEREATIVPGKFPEEGISANSAVPREASVEDSPSRAPKRRQVSNPTDEIAKNWVVVPPSAPSPKPAVSRIPQPRPTTGSRYSMPTASSANRRSTPARPASRASSALGGGLSTRKSGLGTRVSHAGSPSLQSHRGASFASPRSPTTTPNRRNSTLTSPGFRAAASAGATAAAGINGNSASPAAIEAQRWAAMKRKQEREADESIRRLDAQLKAMIREGKEALGTKIEVEMDDEDFEDTHPGIRKWDF